MRLQKLFVLLIALCMSVFLLTGCQSDDSSGSSSSSGFSISPASSSIAMGASTKLTATNNGSDVSSSATWSSSDTSVVSVSNATNNSSYPKGTITGKRTGTASITATYNGGTATSAITVTSATLDTVEVNPTNPSLALAATPSVQFTATGIYSDGTKLDLTEYVTWSSGTTATATINNTTGQSGTATTAAAGTSTISAVYKLSSGDVTGSSVLTLTGDTVDSLEVTPIDPSIADGTTLPFIGTIIVTDGTTKKTQDVTNNSVWTSATAATGVISNAAGSMGRVTALAAGSSAINASYGATTATASTLTVTGATLNKLQILPAAPSIAIGVDYQLTAKGVYLTGSVYSHQDLTDSVVWSSSDTAVATVCNSSACKGKISPLKAGTSTITAGMPGSITKTITLTVNSADLTLTEIQVTPTNPSIHSGTTQQFTATGVYSDGTSYFHEDITENVIWSSSDKAVAIVSNASGSEGTVRNIAAGTATITATLGKISQSSALTILASTMALSSIEVSPANPYIAEGMKQQFTAMGVFTDGTTTALKDITDEVIWTYTHVSGANPNIRICNADNCKGQASSMAVAPNTPGVSTITATLGAKSGTSTSTVFDTTAASDYKFEAIQITPEPSSISLAVGASQQLQAIGIFNDANDVKKMNLTDTVTWISSDPSVATVDNLNGTSGMLRALKAGSTTISASWTDLSPTTPTAPTKSITVNSHTLDSIQISPSNKSLDLGMTQQYKAVGIYTDGSTYMVNELPYDLSWFSADSSAASTINVPIGSDYHHHGLGTTLTAGTNTITARYGSTSASETLTTSDVTLQSITISPSSPTIALGTKTQFKAYGAYSDNINRDITHLVRWSSGTAGTAVIRNSPDDKGLATSVAAGTSIITAALGSISGNTTLTVKINTIDATTGLQVTPSTPVMGAGTTLQLNANGIFTAGSSTSQDLTGLVYWTTSDSTKVTVNNSDGANGRVYGVAAGSATLTAYWTGANVSAGSTTVTVTSGTLSSIEISPDQPAGPIGYSEQLTATALYSDNNTQDISESVIWSSSDTSIITVSNEEGSRGKITRKTYGSATITARFGTTSATTTVTVW